MGYGYRQIVETRCNAKRRAAFVAVVFDAIFDAVMLALGGTSFSLAQADERQRL